VLIIDDHAPSRAALAEAITAQGGQVVGNGSRAEDVLRLVDKHRPDVAVLAVGLPDGDGVRPREVMAVSPCPVVLVTSHTDAPVVARAVDAGVLGFLAKPVRAEELGPTLDVAVHRFREIEAMRKENEALKRKLESRKLVERAKGILMTRLGLSEPEAFRRIQKTAMDTRRPMAEVRRRFCSPRNGPRPGGSSRLLPKSRAHRRDCLPSRQSFWFPEATLQRNQLISLSIGRGTRLAQRAVGAPRQRGRRARAGRESY
jgi:response regulator NasT